MDLAPSFLPDVQIARDPVFNVAYWNLAHRRPAFEGGRWRLEGRPLGFFHFSGLPLDDLERVSRYQDRIRLSERPELRPLFEDYRRRLLAAGHGTLRDLPYAYGRFADGRPVPDLARRVYQRVDPHGRRWPDAFAPGPQGFAAWLTEPLAFSGGMLTRAALSLWEENEDLRRRFPDPCGAQAQALAEHLRQGVAARGGLPHDFLGVLGGAEADAPTPGERGDGPDPARPGALAAWWNEPMGALSERPLVTRFALHVHARRADARQVYPEPLGRDRRAFAYWFAVIGADEVDAADELVAPVRRSLGLRSRLSLAVRRFRRARAERTAAKVRPHAPAAVVEVSAAPAPFGVNLVARFDDPGDDGALARGTRAALQAGGIPVAEIALDRDARLDLLRGQFAPPQGLPYAVTLVHLSPGDTPRALERLPLAARAGSRVVGYWLWHLAHFPLDLAPSFAGLDEVWTPSRATAEAVRALSPLPVRCVPPGLDAGLGDAPPRAGGETLVWLSLADARTGVERFDLETLIKAFALACSRSPRPLELHLHLEGAGSGTLARLREISPGLAVKLDARCLTPVERAARLHDCDAFVTLARAEGLGLTALSALRLARPVVAADCGGPRDWLGTDTGFPVATRPARLDHGVAPFPRGAVWAAADVDSAVAALLAVSQGLDAAAARARVGQARVAEVYDAAPAARRWAEELRRLCDGPGA
jgi:glycosyltransferase involved in cell wall biosynthesis